MGFKFSSYYNDDNIKLSDERIEELLIQYLEEFPIEEDIFQEEIKIFETFSPLARSKYTNKDLNVNSLNKKTEIDYSEKVYETLETSANVFGSSFFYRVA